MRRLAGALLVMMLPAVVAGQSLGDAARKENERRKKNRDAGVKSPSFSDQNVAPRPTTEPAGSSSPAAEKTADLPDESLLGDAPPRRRDESDQRAEKERYWRQRKAEVVARRDEAKRKYDALNQLWLAPNESYVDERGRTVIRDREHLQRLVAQAKAEWQAAEKAIEALEDEARRAGALPGWLR